MEKREGKPLFFKALLVIGLIIFVEIGFFAYSIRGSFSTGITGDAIKTAFFESFVGLGFFSKVLFIGQWLVFILIAVGLMIHDRKRLEGEETVYVTKAGQETDLDSLYKILKEKKALSLKTISKSFNVSSQVAMEWCKILEEAGLVKIEYSFFGTPIITFKESEAGDKESEGIIKNSLNKKPETSVDRDGLKKRAGVKKIRKIIKRQKKEKIKRKVRKNWGKRRV